MVNTTEQRDYLTSLEEIAVILQKTQVNLKKCPKARLTYGYVKEKSKCVEEYWRSFKYAHECLAKCTPKDKRDEISYFLKEEYFVYEELYLSIQADLTDLMTKIQQPTTSVIEASESLVHNQGNAQLSLVKLPRIQLPTFTGKYEEWPTFQDMFNSLVHQNVSISNVQKLQYLKSSVSGEAEIILKHIQVTDSNYNQAWQSLKERYGNKRVIVFSVLKKLFNQKKINSQTSNNLKNLLDTTSECINNLKNLEISTDSWDPIIIFLVSQKLDQESHKEWESQAYKEKSDKLPTWENLREFLETKFRTLEMIQPESTTKTKFIKTQSYHTMNDKKPKSCILCPLEHKLSNCEDFTKMNIDERSAYVKSQSLCFNCLLPGHAVSKCKNPMSCRFCKRRHHSLLHRTQQSSVPVDTQQALHAHVENNENIAIHHVGFSGTALLATAIVKAKSRDGNYTNLRILIDQGSQANFISEKAVQLLRLKRNPIECDVTGVGSSRVRIKHIVQFELSSLWNSDFKINIEAYVMCKQLTTQLPNKIIQKQDWQHLCGLTLADPTYNEPGRIDLLLGVKDYTQIIEEQLIKGPPGSPCAQKTTLGWILFGELNTKPIQKKTSLVVMHHQLNISDMLKNLWEIDTNTKRKYTKEEMQCQEIYEKTYKRNQEGRFIVKLPFKTENIQCINGNTRNIAMQRLIQLEKRFKRQPKLKEDYTKVIQDYLNLKHMEEVPKSEIYTKASCYLPHHPVLREDKETTKIRIVFDASCKGDNGVSLNDELLPGPVLQEDLRSIMMRWRMHAICFLSDIQMMYRMVNLNREDIDYQRILWRDESSDVKDYRLLTVTFGTTSAPYLAVRSLIQLSRDELASYPEAADIMLSDCYVDDVMSGCDTIQQAQEAVTQLSDMLKKGGFVLKKWASNSIDLIRFIDPNNISSQVQHEIHLDGTIKALGITWNLKTDKLLYKINLTQPPLYITKRNVLSDIQKLYDPLGWISPSIVLSKMFIQKLWLSGLNWDESLTEELTKEWLQIRNDLENVNDICLNRWIHTYNYNKKNVQLHGFSDASTKAYAAVVYIRVKQNNNTIQTSLIASRTKVAPLKTLSLPRLELCGALLLSRLIKQISEAMRIPYKQIFCWTDSTIVLAWLRGEPQKWKTFVANRVVEIKDNTNALEWLHVESPDNPADISSRGMLLKELKEKEIWWNGPKWLLDREIKFRTQNEETDLELKLTCQTLTTEYTKDPIWERFSNLTKMKRVLSYCKRMKKGKNKEVYITTHEMNLIMQSCIRYYQELVYEKEIEDIKKRGSVRKSSSLIRLTPFLDSNNILRVGGRLQNSSLSISSKHPILIPNNQHITRLLIDDAHQKTLHGGINLMITYLRSTYWIIGLKSAVRKCIRSCKVCILNQGKVNQQLMGQLPAERVTPSRAFINSGVDYAGPVWIRTSKGRGHHATKGYICLFVCMVTHAIHLEAVTDLTAQAFLAAFRRFVARRGRCSNLWSDNGTNFVGAAKELKDLFNVNKDSLSKEIAELLATEGTTWHFIPPRMPNCGGLWEAGVQSAKRHLTKVSKDTRLTYEEMSTLLAQIEACLNSRPLCQLDDTLETLSPLTPGHFLIGESLLAVPDDNFEKSNVNLLTRWQHIQKMVQDFWKQWQSEYLHTLQQRTKWQSKVINPKIGDLCVIKEDGLPPTRWLLGIIKLLHPGKDNLVRVVTVQCKGQNELKRPLSKLIFLPVSASSCID